MKNITVEFHTINPEILVINRFKRKSVGEYEVNNKQYQVDIKSKVENELFISRVRKEVGLTT